MAEQNDALSDEDRATLDHTRHIRQTLVKSLVGENIRLPDDKTDKAVLLSLLDGIDKDVVNRNRIKIAAKTEQAIGNMSGVIAQALLKHRPGEPLIFEDRIIELPDSIPAVQTVPGEMSIGVISLTQEDLDE